MVATLVLIATPTSLLAEMDSGSIRDQATSLDRLHSLLVVHEGQTVLEHVQGGPGIDAPANIKSLSKTILATLGGIAIERGVVEGLDQPITALLGDRVPDSANSRVEDITFGHLLSMQAGLESTSGGNYGAWVQSANWVEHVLTRPFVDEPGGQMIYSSGTTHLASAALATASGQSTLELARDWLGEPLNIRIPDWMQDPQGIHFGGNEMLLSPRALAQFGALFLEDGQVNGRQVLSPEWIEEAWTPRGRSPWTGDDYGLGWFITRMDGRAVYYGRGFGGQMLYLVPAESLVVVVTSDPQPPSPGGHYFRQLGDLVERTILPAIR